MKAALRALSSCLDPAAPEQLIAALQHEAWDVRKLSGELLEELAVHTPRNPCAGSFARDRRPRARDPLHALAALEGLG